MHRQVCNFLAFESHSAFVRPDDTNNHIEGCGLSSAIWTKQTDDFAHADRDRNAIYDAAMSIFFDQLFGDQQLIEDSRSHWRAEFDLLQHWFCLWLRHVFSSSLECSSRRKEALTDSGPAEQRNMEPPYVGCYDRFEVRGPGQKTHSSFLFTAGRHAKYICWYGSRRRIRAIDFIFARSHQFVVGAIKDEDFVFEDAIGGFENWVSGQCHCVIGAARRDSVIINSVVAGAMNILRLILISALETEFDCLFRRHGNVFAVRVWIINIHGLADPIQARMDDANAALETRRVRGNGVGFGINIGEFIGRRWIVECGGRFCARPFFPACWRIWFHLWPFDFGILSLSERGRRLRRDRRLAHI